MHTADTLSTRLSELVKDYKTFREDERDPRELAIAYCESQDYAAWLLREVNELPRAAVHAGQ